MPNTKLRWGILGTSQIARKNWNAIRLSGNGALVAVASRDLERSRKFIADCQAAAPFEVIPQALGGYTELIESKDVDAVYLPLPTGVRKEWALQAASAGKHIVCEKPCALNVADLREILDACRRHRVQFMDGVMFMHSRRLDSLRRVLDDGESVGDVRRISSAFSFRADADFFTRNIRVQKATEPFGCLGDLGWYCIRLALWVMNWQMPLHVTGHCLSQVDGPKNSGVPAEFSGEMHFAHGVSAGFYCSFLAENQQWAVVSGTNAYLQMPDFVLPFADNRPGYEIQKSVFRVQGCDFRMEPHSRLVSVAEQSHGHADAQESKLFRNFAEQVHSGKLNEIWPSYALQTQAVMCACYESAKLGGQLVRPGEKA